MKKWLTLTMQLFKKYLTENYFADKTIVMKMLEVVDYPIFELERVKAIESDPTLE